MMGLQKLAPSWPPGKVILNGSDLPFLMESKKLIWDIGPHHQAFLNLHPPVHLYSNECIAICGINARGITKGWSRNIAIIGPKPWFSGINDSKQSLCIFKVPYSKIDNFSRGKINSSFFGLPKKKTAVLSKFEWLRPNLNGSPSPRNSEFIEL
jgi:hypothetical protein